jgi:hypothetical protein
LFEGLEPRQLLVVPIGFLQGIAFVDTNRDLRLDPGETRLSGLTITLQDTLGRTLNSTQTAADGSYRFTNLGPGTYRVVEQPPGNYIAEGTQVQNSVSTGTALNVSAIQVSLPDFERFATQVQGQGPGRVVSFHLDGAPGNDGQGNYSTFVGQYDLQVRDQNTNAPISGPLAGYCADLFNPAQVGATKASRCRTQTSLRPERAGARSRRRRTCQGPSSRRSSR